MAISMVGIIALIAGGGLGQMVLRGVQTLNIPLAASAGLALYLVAGIVAIRQALDFSTGKAAIAARRVNTLRVNSRLMK